MNTKRIYSVLKSNATKEDKKTALIEVGLTETEVTELLALYEDETDVLYTIGVEIECIGTDKNKFKNLCHEYKVDLSEENYNHQTRRHFKVVTDSSLRGADPIEVVSPILRNKAGIDNLEKVCKALNKAGANVNRSCGLHVHFGLQNINFETYKNVFINYHFLEKAIDKMVADSRRGDQNFYCKSLKVAGDFAQGIKLCNDRQQINDILNSRYFKVNPISYQRHNTIEFRQHQGTINFQKIRAWVTFLTFLVKFSENNVLTNYVENIEDIPTKILNKNEKKYFINRSAELS